MRRKRLWMIVFLGLLVGCGSHVEIDNNRVWHAGHPSFADDGSDDVIFIKKKMDEGLVFPPLQGWTGKTNPRFSVHKGRSLSSNEAITGIYSGYALDLFYMKQAGYIALTFLRQPEEARGGMVFGLDGTERLVLEPDDFSFKPERFKLIPSRDGSTLAAIATRTDWDSLSDGLYTIDFEVQLYDATSLAPLLESTITKQLKTLYDARTPVFTWQDAETLLISDNESGAFLVGVDGAVTDTELPTCARPSSSSSRYSPARGEFLEIEGDAIVVSESYQILGLPLCDN